MRSLMMAAPVLAAALLATPANATSWYWARLGNETCVDLDNVGEHFVNLHNHSGSMHEPDDVLPFVQRMGLTITRIPHTDMPYVAHFCDEPLSQVT